MSRGKVKLTEAQWALLRQAHAALSWFINNDETNEGDTPIPEYSGKTWNELNAFWIEGLRSGVAARDAIGVALSQDTEQTP